MRCTSAWFKSLLPGRLQNDPEEELPWFKPRKRKEGEKEKQGNLVTRGCVDGAWAGESLPMGMKSHLEETQEPSPDDGGGYVTVD